MTDKRQLYNDFLAQFPIEKLSEMTLEQYTNLQKDNSFCYWLESKTFNLGSIWGGSSYKFGIYKYNKKPNLSDKRIMVDDVYAWYSKYNKESASEAFAVVKTAIIRIATAANSANFEDIENVKELGDAYKWKIAFLYSHEQLIPIYSIDLLRRVASYYSMPQAKDASRVEIQKFLIDKKGDEDLFAFYDKLLHILDEDKSGKPTVWIYAPGEKSSMWEFCQTNKLMCIGWDDMGDLSTYASREEMREKLRTIYNNPEASYMNDSLALWEFVHEVRQGDIVYAKKGRGKIIGRGVVKGEYIYDDNIDVYPNIRQVEWTHVGEWNYSKNQLVLKTLTNISKYPDFVEELDNIVCQSLNPQRYWWLNASPRIWNFSDMAVGEKQSYTLYNNNGNRRRIFQNFLNAKKGDVVIGYEANPIKKVVAICEIATEQDGKEIQFVKKESLTSPIDYSTLRGVPELEKMEFFVNPNGSLFSLTREEYDTIMDIIREENPLPVKQTAEKYDDMDFLREVYLSKQDLNTLKLLLQKKKNIILQGAPGVGKTFAAKRLAYTIMGEKDEQRIEMVQFHQNYSYEDFFVGYKPTSDGGFEIRNGIFYQFCKKAQDRPDKDFFFIIDEINRGNLSKIFGELLMLIEDSYRGTEIKLGYTSETFSVPKNVYIIGMMNTADRSLAMIDYALRRRFSFYDMHPGFDTQGFKAYQESLNSPEFDKVVNAIRSLNEAISKDDSLGDGFCIGHSYFCNQEESFNVDWLRNVITFDILPMLKEYWFDDVQKYNQQEDALKGLFQ